MGHGATDKYDRLRGLLAEMGSAAVAYSGGIDSTLVAKVAFDVLGSRAMALTAVSPSLASRDRLEAERIAVDIGIRHVQIESHETDDPRYQENNSSRCFFCKTNVYEALIAHAEEQGIRNLADGTNADDVGDHRPGREAARQWGVRSPLQEAGLGKDEIRAIARELGLANWNKPAAACLASRIPYGTEVSSERLSQVERAEDVLVDLGFSELRVRHHDAVARIEVPPDRFESVLRHREYITAQLREIGYQYVTLDLAGFRSGSLNEMLRTNASRS